MKLQKKAYSKIWKANCWSPFSSKKAYSKIWKTNCWSPFSSKKAFGLNNSTIAIIAVIILFLIAITILGSQALSFKDSLVR